jgi:hypothetical protein
MHVEGNKLVMGRKDCNWCAKGKVPGRKPCIECKATGKGKRGKKGGCKECRGSTTVWDYDNEVTCTQCKGNYQGFTSEDHTSYMPKEMFPTFTFKVYRHNRPITGNESHLGAGCVYSCHDYGDAYKANNDDALIAKVKESGSHQACKVCKEDGTLADHIGIFVSTGGYSVRAVFDLNAVLAGIVNERPEGEYMRVGMKIAHEGGNGTLGALTYDGSYPGS